MRKCLQGFEDCHKFLQEEASKDVEQFPLLYMMLKDKVVEIFTAFDSVEDRMVLGNKLARLR